MTLKRLANHNASLKKINQSSPSYNPSFAARFEDKAKGAATTMRSTRMAMGLVLLRTTTTLAWIQSFRVNRWISLKVAKSGFQSTTLAASVSPFSSTNPERASKTTETATTIATDSSDANGHPELKNKRTGMGKKFIDVSNVQPLLQKHMADLAARNRRTVKARQHVNPLAATFQQPVDLPKRWFESAFEKPNAPLMVDIGCAKGTFLMGMAKAHPNRNFLGLEIRRPIAAVGLARAAELGTRNCHLVCCNANVDLDVVLTDAIRDGASIDAICIHFPDPHFKAKHYKRRVLQPELVACIERHLQPEGIFFMQSDVLDVLQDMRVITRETAALLEDTRPNMEDWMEGPDQNPFGVQTEREKVTYRKESPEENRVYRSMFVKRKSA